jgi:hypothetical protein
MSALPQCDAFGFIYDQAGDPAPDVLVTLKKVIDASGNSILLSPLTTLTDPAGSFHFTLPEDAAATISARASGLWNCPDGRTFKVPPGPSGELIATFLLPGSSSVVPPLIYVSDTLSLPRSSLTADGYLSAADFVRFDAATDIVGGVSSFNGRVDDVLPLLGDYQAFYLALSGGALTGPLTLAADPTLPMQAVTMQYVLNQIAGATAGVSSFNGRNGAVDSEVGDYAAFYAPIAHTHTRTQITDLGVFSTSQPGLVPQPTVGDAAKVLTGAGTWVVPAATGSSTLPGEYLASSFKASGSAKKFTGSVGAGSTALTTTAASDFVVGQGIYITNAGTGGTQPLITKVDAISGTSITLHDPAVSPVTNLNVQHDDTVALQTAINSVIATVTSNNTPRGGTLVLDGDYYRVNGPLVSGFNSILTIPYNPTDSGHTNPVIKIKGYVPNRMPTFLGPFGESVVIQTDKICPDGSWILSTGTFVAGTDITSANSTTVYIEDVSFRTYANPQIGGIDFGVCAEPIIKNVCIDTGILMTAAQPSHAQTALRLPRCNITGYACTDNVWIGGFNTGVIASEEWVAPAITTAFCNIGIQFVFGYHMTGVVRATVFDCPTSVHWQGELAVDMTLDMENGPPGGGWYSTIPGRVLYDPSHGFAKGVVRHFNETSGIGGGTPGTPLSPDFTGCEKLNIIDLNGFGSKIPTLSSTAVTTPSLTATDTAITKLNGQVVSFGANDSAETNYRAVEVPNAVADVTPPSYSSIVVTPSTTTATIQWTTSEPADSQVEYGLSAPAYGSITTLDPARVITHNVSLSGLALTTTYHYRLLSRDAAGNMVPSADQTFTTSAVVSPLLANLVSYWRHDDATGNSTDAHGANHLVPSGGITTVAGRLGNARSGDGSGQLTCVDNASLNFSANKSITVNGWLKYRRDGTFNLSTILGKWNGTPSTQDFLLIYIMSTGTFEFAVKNAGGLQGTADTPFYDLPVDTWVMVTGVFDFANSQVSVRFNAGTPVTIPFAGPVNHSTVDLTSLEFAGFKTSGDIDECGLWARVLTSTEIAQLYGGGTPPAFPW